ncbi:MAG: flagellar hook-length control protein FliK [Moorella sp. (in: firmicutes)]
MTVQAMAKIAGREPVVRERDWRRGAGNDFALYLAGLLHQAGFAQPATSRNGSNQGVERQETAGEEVDAVKSGGSGRGKAAAGPDNRAGRQVGAAGLGGAGEDLTPSRVKARQGENQDAAVKPGEALDAEQGAEEPAGKAAGAAGKAAAPATKPHKFRLGGMPWDNGAPPGDVNILRQEEPGTLFAGRKAASPEAVTGRDAVPAAVAVQGKKGAAVAAGEGAAVLRDEASLAPEGVLMARIASVPGHGLEVDPAPGLKVAGSKTGLLPGVPEDPGQDKGSGELFARDAGDRAGAPGGREDVFPVRNGALARTAAGSSQAGLTTAKNILNSTEPGPGMNHTGGQREPGTVGGAGITGNDSIVTGQGSFPTVFLGTDWQAGGMVLPVSNLPEVMTVIMASARMSRSGSQQELEIQLWPENLGNMKLKAVLEGGRLVVHLLVENSEAARTLQAAVPEMRQAVAQQGLRLDQVQMQVGDSAKGTAQQGLRLDFDQAQAGNSVKRTAGFGADWRVARGDVSNSKKKNPGDGIKNGGYWRTAFRQEKAAAGSQVSVEAFLNGKNDIDKKSNTLPESGVVDLHATGRFASAEIAGRAPQMPTAPFNRQVTPASKNARIAILRLLSNSTKQAGGYDPPNMSVFENATSMTSSLPVGTNAFTIFMGENGWQTQYPAVMINDLPVVIATLINTERLTASRRQEMEIQLQPEKLGKLKLRAFLEGEKLTLHLLVENKEAARALQAAVPEMRQAVVQQGLRLEQVQVQVGGDGQEGEGYPAGTHDEFYGSGWQHQSQGQLGSQDVQAPTVHKFILDYLA